jgi:hypothetical protein
VRGRVRSTLDTSSSGAFFGVAAVPRPGGVRQGEVVHQATVARYVALAVVAAVIFVVIALRGPLSCDRINALTGRDHPTAQGCKGEATYLGFS